MPPAEAVRGAMLAAVVATLAVALAACSPARPDLDPERAMELVRQEYPDAVVEIAAVEEEGERRRAPARFDGDEVEFVFVPTPDGWALEGVSRDGDYHTVDELRRISQTMQIMRMLAEALESYRQERGGYPEVTGDALTFELEQEGLIGTEQMPVDGWGNELVYEVHRPEYTLASMGPDGRRGTDDDIILVSGRFVSDDRSER